jgi:gluconokinase
MSADPTILVVMGVSGAGKTTIGQPIARRLGWIFQEGDALHPIRNIAKMKSGIALTDADRRPWLEAIAMRIDALIAAGQSAVITCSALKRPYRDILTRGRPQVRFVFLNGDVTTLEERLARRHGHFMPSSLLPSQIADLEPPARSEGVIEIDIDQPVDAQVTEIIAAIQEARQADAPSQVGRT